MKRFSYLLFVLICIILFTFSCSWWKNDDENKSMDDLDVDPYFTFNTDRTVLTQLTGPPDTDFDLYLDYSGDLKSPVNGDTTLLEKLIAETQTDSNGVFDKMLSIPTYYENIYLKSGGEIWELEINRLNGEIGEIIGTFGSKNSKDRNKCLIIKHYYPSKNEFGTLMFEDRWPEKGDYDMNDLVVDYNIVEKYWPIPIWVPGIGWFWEVFEIAGTFRLRATGASYKISFAMQLPNLCYIDGTVTSDLPQGVTVEQDNNTIIFVADVHAAMGAPAGEWVNTDESMTTYPVVEFTFTIPVSYVDDVQTWQEWNGDKHNPIYLPPYNPLIFVNNIRRHEIHMSNYPPTDSADTDLFGTYDDASNQSENIYYRTSNGLPWGVRVAKSSVYPIERKEIVEAFLHFGEWAESGGADYNDWYLDKPGYRDNANIYIAP